VVDSRIEKWLGWLEGTIRADVYAMYLNRCVFRELGAMTRARELPSSYFFDYLGQTYATTQLVAVRRQAETSSRVCTLGRLLREIAQNPEQISRDFYVGLWEDERDRGSKAFDAFAGRDVEHLPPAVVSTDLDELAGTAASVKAYVDEYVAHSDARGKAAVPQFADLDAAIDSIGELFKKYHGLLTASVHTTLVPVLDHDWKAVFRQPWIE